MTSPKPLTPRQVERAVRLEAIKKIDALLKDIAASNGTGRTHDNAVLAIRLLRTIK